jgi:hypothetical protein
MTACTAISKTQGDKGSDVQAAALYARVFDRIYAGGVAVRRTGASQQEM